MSRKWWLILAALLTVARPVQAKEPDDATIERVISRSDRERADRIKRLESAIKNGKTSGKSGKELAKLKTDLKNAKKSDGLLVPHLQGYPLMPKVGDIGRAPPGTPYVRQIVSGTEALIEFVDRRPQLDQAGVPTGESIDKSPFLIRGAETAGWADGSIAKLPNVMEVTGNYSYVTVLGSKATVLVLEPFDMRRVEDVYAERRGRRKP